MSMELGLAGNTNHTIKLSKIFNYSTATAKKAIVSEMCSN